MQIITGKVLKDLVLTGRINVVSYSIVNIFACMHGVFAETASFFIDVKEYKL